MQGFGRMISPLPCAEPTLESHDALVILAEHHVDRAHQKAFLARQELADAVDASKRQKAERRAWIEANPQPQIEMFA